MVDARDLLRDCCRAGHNTLAMVKRYSHMSDEHSRKVVAETMSKVFGDG